MQDKHDIVVIGTIMQRGVLRGTATDGCLDPVDLGDAAQAFSGDLGAVLLIDVMQLASRMRPAVRPASRGMPPTRFCSAKAS